MKKSKEGQPDPRHPEKVQAADRLMKSEAARAERAVKRELRQKEDKKAVREGTERLVHGVSVNPSHPKPIPGEVEHIASQYDGAPLDEIDKTPKIDGNGSEELVRVEEVTVWETPVEGHTDIFAASGVDANPYDGIHSSTFEGYAELDDSLLMTPGDRIREIEEAEAAESDYAGTHEQFE